MTPERFIDNLLELVSTPFREQGSQKLVDVAVAVWYGDIVLLQGFSKVAKDPNVDDLSKRKHCIFWIRCVAIPVFRRQGKRLLSK